MHRIPSPAKKNELKPWKHKGWIIPPEQNGSFVANMKMVLDVYKRPYDAWHPVVCMDESPKQLIAETKTPIPASPGQPAKSDYLRGRSIGTIKRQKSTGNFLQRMRG